VTTSDDGRDHYAAVRMAAEAATTALGAGLAGLDYRVLLAVTALVAPYGWIGDRIGATQIAQLVYDLEAPAASHRSKVTAALRELDEAGAISWLPGRGAARGWVILAPLDDSARAHVRARERAHVRARDVEPARPFSDPLAPISDAARARPRGHSTKGSPLKTSTSGASRNGTKPITENRTNAAAYRPWRENVGEAPE
jgi:hypothetical protein